MTAHDPLCPHADPDSDYWLACRCALASVRADECQKTLEFCCDDTEPDIRRAVLANLRAQVEGLPRMTASEGIGPWNVGYRAAVDDLLALLDEEGK